MNYRIIGEFDSVELAELASGRIKDRFPAADNFSVKPKADRSAKNQNPPYAFPMFSGPVSGYSMIWDNGSIDSNELPEPYDTKEVILSFDIDRQYVDEASGLLTALGGLGVAAF